MRLIAFALLAASAATVSLHAQTISSSVRGTVTDASGAVVAGAQITVVDTRSSARVRAVSSDANGNFEVPDMQPGAYQIKAELAGFKTFVADNIIIEGQQIRRVDIALQLGAVADQVTVEAGAAVISTDSAQITSSLKRNVYDHTPMVRNYYPHSLLVTLAGVESSASGWNLRINGQPAGQVALGMDGITNDGTVNLINRLDFSEITVTGVNNTADQSRVANYNMVSKRGSNDIHGEVWYTHFNSAMNARQFFDPRKIPEKEHRAQAVISGPIFRNKTFFYGSYFYQRIPAGFFYQRNVPTGRMRAGDFSLTGGAMNDPLNRQPFPNRQIPASRINPTSLRIQNRYIPASNQGSADLPVNNYGFLHPFPNDLFEARYPQIRLDHHFGSKNQIFGRYIRRYTPYVLARSLPEFTWTRYRWHTGWVVTDTHIFSPNVVNTFRWGLKYDYVDDGRETSGVKPIQADQAIQEMGIQGVNQRGFKVQGSPQINITGLASLDAPGGGTPQKDYLHSFADSITWSKGRHILKFGGELKKQSAFAGNIPAATFGVFTFNGSLSGQPHGDFLLGLPFSSERLDPFTNRTRYAYEFGAFAMDTFKVSQKLTLDYGLRWDWFSSARFKDGRQYAFDAASGNLLVPQDALQAVRPNFPRTISVAAGNVIPKADLANWRPRLGAAYRLSDKSVIRGGFGTFTEQIGYFARVQGGGPFELSETYFNTIENGAPQFAFPNAFPSSIAAARVPAVSISAFPNRTNNGTIYQYNLSVERQVGEIGLRASYIGSRSIGQNFALNINKPRPGLTPFAADRRPYPQFVNVVMARSSGRSVYNGLQLEAQRKAGAFLFDVHYTYQSNLSNFLNLENPYNTSMWNREAFAARHRAVTTLQYELPFGRGKRFLNSGSPALDQAFGGWRVITVSFFASGQFFTPVYAGADPSNTNSFGGIPDRNCDGNLPRGSRSVANWFDAACFAVPAAGRFGNSGVNVLERPGLHLHHLSLTKNFKITERFNVEYVLAASNIFNHPTFAPPPANISAPRPAQITSILFGADQSLEKTRARELEMTIKVRW